MDFIEAKETLKNGYLNGGLTLVSEDDKSLSFKYRDNLFLITEEDIRGYSIGTDIFPMLIISPGECSICSTTYREQVVELLDNGRNRLLLPRYFSYDFGIQNNDRPFVSIGPASNLFVNYLRFSGPFLSISLDRISRHSIRYNDIDPTPMIDAIFRPLTIKIQNIREDSCEATIKHTDTLIDACLFELSYIKNIPLTTSEQWQIRQPRIRPFIFGEEIKGNNLPLPNANFNSATIKFYQRGMSTEDPINQYLSFYQVLEYFFIEVSDELLYLKLSRQINDPKSNTKPKYLDKIIQEVMDFKRDTDETEMLKNVLNKFIDEKKLIDFVSSYEIYLNKKIYTKKRSLFGEEIQINLTSGYTIPSLAKVIKTIRNALVHSSDRYERKDRYIPSTSSEAIIQQEVPLIKFLAEQVIIASAQ
jgi:hypothetical protein